MHDYIYAAYDARRKLYRDVQRTRAEQALLVKEEMPGLLRTWTAEVSRLRAAAQAGPRPDVAWEGRYTDALHCASTQDGAAVLVREALGRCMHRLAQAVRLFAPILGDTVELQAAAAAQHI